MASRRDFLKGLFAASIASQMPDITPAKAEVLADAARRAIRVDIDEITAAGITKHPGGWYRVWVVGRSMDARISFGDHAATYRGINFDGQSEDIVFSTFVKFDDDEEFALVAGSWVIPSP